MLASTKVLLALALSPTLVSPVLLVKVTASPLAGVMESVVVVFPTVLPATVEVRVSVQLPVARTVLQEAAPRLRSEERRVGKVSISAGALRKHVPSLTLTWAVRV